MWFLSSEIFADGVTKLIFRNRKEYWEEKKWFDDTVVSGKGFLVLGNGKGNWKSHSCFTGRERELEKSTAELQNVKSFTRVKMIFIYSEHMKKCSKLQIMILFPVLIPRLHFPGNGKGNLKCHGKGREIWGLFSRESREMGIFAHPCDDKYKYDVKLGLKFSHLHLQCNIWLPQPVLWKTAEFKCFYLKLPFFHF